ncbi:AIG1 family [Musa troglodytarum]|uniref:AIG1 family n=1 Tax=Musa troglodytarum TaxID=320322 RepID=A0A9E7HYX9_9LILI|nr:AIG1 family [Musa troglodytarum]
MRASKLPPPTDSPRDPSPSANLALVMGEQKLKSALMEHQRRRWRSQEQEGALRLQHKEKEVESMKGYSEQQISALKEEICRSYDDQLARVAEMVEHKLNQTMEELKKLLAEEQATRLKAEKISQEVTKRSDTEIKRLKASLGRAQKDAEEFRMRAENKKSCVFL